MDFGVLIPNVNQIIKYPYQKVNKGDLGFFSVPIVQKSTPFTRLTTDSYWRIVLLSEGGFYLTPPSSTPSFRSGRT